MTDLIRPRSLRGFEPSPPLSELPADRAPPFLPEIQHSCNLAPFTAEMMIHFSGRKQLENPGVLTFSEMLDCLDCGSTRFTIAEAELKLLREGNSPLTAPEHKPLHFRAAS